MKKSKITYIAILFFLSAAAHAQIFCAAPVAEAIHYGKQNPAILYGISLSSDDSVSIGARVLYGQSFDEEKQLTSFELTFFFRIYILNFAAVKGLFAQLNYGAAFFSKDSAITIPSEFGSLSAGLSVGYRFLLGRRFFIEPYVRVGYPYYGGIGLSAGIRL